MIKDLEIERKKHKREDGGYGHGGDSYARIFVPRRDGHARSLQTSSLSLSLRLMLTIQEAQPPPPIFTKTEQSSQPFYMISKSTKLQLDEYNCTTTRLSARVFFFFPFKSTQCISLQPFCVFFLKLIKHFFFLFLFWVKTVVIFTLIFLF